ncbi:MAG: M24 family metallopeptidase [Cellulosilyticaceae bacterium]
MENNKNLLIQRLLNHMEALKIDVMLINNLYNVRYMSGFAGSNGMLYIAKDKQLLITDFRYIEQAQKQAPGYEIVNQGNDGLIKTAMKIAEKNHVRYIGFESDHTNYSTFLELKAYDTFKFVPTKNVIEEFRRVKTAEEIDKLRKAESIGDLAFSHIISLVTLEYKNGLTENDIALELERVMRKNGASGTSFASIVAAGAKSSLCHAVPGNEILSHGDLVVMDFGCIYEGYCSDMTRTIAIESVSSKQKEIYDTVLNAQLVALEAIRPGKTGHEIDKVARDFIKEAGYGEYFGHGLGHATGLEIHENPRFSMTDQTILEPGMVITVEPGIYVPNLGGVRIEDLVVITENGIENLTKSPKEMIIIQ